MLIQGGPGVDFLFGTAFADQIYGFGGNDHIRLGSGPDAIDGGIGIDMVRAQDSNAGVTINLTTGVAKGGWAAGDSYKNVENLLGSFFDDTLVGDDNVNVIFGYAGADIVSGMGGNDDLYGGGYQTRASLASRAAARDDAGSGLHE